MKMLLSYKGKTRAKQNKYIHCKFILFVFIYLFFFACMILNGHNLSRTGTHKEANENAIVL